MFYFNANLLIKRRLIHLYCIIIGLLFFTSNFPIHAGILSEINHTQQTLFENQQKWQQSGLTNYTFTVQKTCFCPQSDSLPIQFNIESSQVIDSSYDCSGINFIRPEPLCDERPDSRLNQTVESLFQIIQGGIDNNADKITVEYNPTYGFPTSIFIDFIELAVDDEVNYQISDFQPTSNAPLKIKTSTVLINHQWKQVNTGSNNSNSVIFYSAPSSVGGQRGVVRMRGDSANPQFRFQEWSNYDGTHVDEQIGYVSINKGHWQTDQYQIEVGTTEISGTERWVTVNFPTSFSEPPQVIADIQTANGADAVSVRIRNITKSSMEIQLVEEDIKKFSGHVTEVVGYLLVASSSASFEVEGGQKIELLSKDQAFLINHVWQSLATGLWIRIEEDLTLDLETFHLKELVHLLRIGKVYLSQIVSDNGSDNGVLRSKSEFFEDLNRKESLIKALVANKSCDSNEQCQEIAYGSKPCGGPWSYLIYSTNNTNQATLTSEVTAFNELQRLQNEKEGAVSDCSVVVPSFPVCSNSLCVEGDQPPPSTEASNLTRFESDQTLEMFIKAGLMEMPGFISPGIAFGPGSPLVEFSPAAPSDANGRFSTTNIQETGVDEADFLKSDGQFMYVGDSGNQQIRVLKMHSEPYRVTQQATIEDGSDNARLSGLYLLTDREQQLPDLLTTIHTNFEQAQQPFNLSFAPEPWFYPWFWMNQVVEINLYNVEVPSTPQRFKTYSIEGSLLASRLIGDSLYVVTRFIPNIQPLLATPDQTLEEREKERELLIQQASLSDLLPSVSSSIDDQTETKTTLVNSQQTFLPPLPDQFHSSDLLTISRFDLSNPDSPPKTTTLVGNSDTIYVSRDAIYLATSIFGYEKSVAVLDAVQNDTVPPQNVEIFIPNHTTQIHKIKMTKDQPEYMGSGTIEGILSGNDDLRRFRFSEYNNILRVVTTGQWGEMGEHRVTLLQENQVGNLDEISHLPNSRRPQRIGKPNEQLYATRYVNNRLFIVTFLKVDPLIAVDLSDKTDPKIEGELEIPGYSDYLHPINENLLLGIGKHTAPAGTRGDGRFVWFQGIRLGLFDVSSTEGPKELDTIVIGERGSQSETLFDIHSFSFLPADQQGEKPFKFTIPISVYGATFPSLNNPNPTDQKDWSHTGLYLFEVDTTAPKPAFKTSGVIKAAERNNSQQFQNGSVGTNRAVLFDDGLFYSHNQEIWSSDWLTPAQAIGPQ